MTNPVVIGASSGAHQGCLRMRGHCRMILVPIIVAMLYGCTTMVADPEIGSDHRLEGDYPSARKYLIDARTSFEDKRTQAVQLSNLTKFGTGVGIIGAGVTAVFRGSADLMLGLLTGGGISYAANQSVAPKTQIDIYSAGIANLTCIDNAAAIAQSAVNVLGTPGHLRTLRNRLDTQSAALKADIVALNRPDTDEVKDAQTLVTAAQTLIRGIDSVTQPPIGVLMVNDVDHTIDAVNEQIAAKAPSIDAIRQVGATLSTFTGTAAGLKAQADAARKQINAANVVTGMTAGAATSVEQKMDHDKTELKKTIAETPTTLPTANLKALEQCQMKTPGDAALELEPDGPITLPAGTAAQVVIAQDDAYSVDWIGDVPSDVDTNIGTHTVRFTAHADAKKHNYTFRISGHSGKSSAAQSLKVEVPAPAAAKPKPRVQPKPNPDSGAAGKGGGGGAFGGPPPRNGLVAPPAPAATSSASATVPSPLPGR